MKKIIVSLISLIFFAPCVSFSASDTIKIGMGKKLFNDPKLANSTNDKSCNTCHPDGKGIGVIDKKGLRQIINRCIVEKLNGEELDLNSDEMNNLRLYIRSLNTKASK